MVTPDSASQFQELSEAVGWRKHMFTSDLEVIIIDQMLKQKLLINMNSAFGPR